MLITYYTAILNGILQLVELIFCALATPSVVRTDSCGIVAAGYGARLPRQLPVLVLHLAGAPRGTLVAIVVADQRCLPLML